MGDDGGVGIIVGIIILVLSLIAFACGCYVGGNAERKQAMEAKVGRYVVHAGTGHVEFVYGPDR